MTSKACRDGREKIAYGRHSTTPDQAAENINDGSPVRRPRRRTAAAATCTQSRYGAKVQALPWGRTAQAPIRVLPLFDGSAQRDH
jgi:hypothetical protein